MLAFMLWNNIEVINVKYYSINEFSKILGVSVEILRNWVK